MDAAELLRVRCALDNGLGTANPILPEAEREALVRYLDLLHRWNRRYNLTAVRDPVQSVSRHLLDCLSVSPFVSGRAVLDVGTGAGLPGLVLAITRPELDLVLLDSRAVKTRFCRHAVAELALANVEVVTARVEDYTVGRGFDTVVARALGRPGDILTRVRHLFHSDARLVLMKGRYPAAELAELGPIRENARIVPVSVPGVAAARHVLVIELSAADAGHAPDTLPGGRSGWAKGKPLTGRR